MSRLTPGTSRAISFVQMPGYDHLIQRAQEKRARDQRLAKARTAIAELLRDEKEELLVELLSEVNPGETSASETSPSPPAQQIAIADGTGQAVYSTKPDGYTVQIAILDAARDGKARTAGDLIDATKAIHPWVNENSIPAAIARLANGDPPRLLKRGRSSSGHPKYVIAPIPTVAATVDSKVPDAKGTPQ